MAKVTDNPGSAWAKKDINQVKGEQQQEKEEGSRTET